MRAARALILTFSFASLPILGCGDPAGDAGAQDLAKAQTDLAEAVEGDLGSTVADLANAADLLPSCDPGYQDHDGDGSCTETCVAAGITCGTHAACSDANGTAGCRCAAGYQDHDRDGNCTETCATAALSCGLNAHCSDAGGTASCVCDTGYQDADHDGACAPSCATGAFTCGANAVCVLTGDDRGCACVAGYQDKDGDGDCSPSCVTAALACGSNAACTDADGVAICACDAGYQDRDTNGSCTATCATAGLTCGANAACSDATGTAKCACAAGFQDSDGDGDCALRCASAGLSCAVGYTCSDTSGVAACVCLDGDADGICDAVDRCVGPNTDLDNDGVLDGCDCAPADKTKGGSEVCDGVDNDCDGVADNLVGRTCLLVDTTVDAADADASDGLCLDSNGHCSLRAALGHALTLSGPVSIYLPAGTYKPTGTAFAVSGDVQIRGVGPTTIVDGNALANAFTVDSGGELSLVKLTVQNAATSAITCTSCPGLSLDTVTLQNNGSNVAGNQGGGLFVRSANTTAVTITGSTLSTNTAYLGGAAYLWAESGKHLVLDVTSTTVTANKGTSSAGTTGAGLDVQLDSGAHGTVSIAKSTFTSNVSSRNGGGLAVAGTGAAAELTVDDSSFVSNSCDRGCGVYVGPSSSGAWTVRISRSTFWKNGGSEGGAFYFQNSSAAFDGRAENVTVSENSGQGQVNLVMNGGSTALEHVTIIRGTNGTAGGLLLLGGSSGSVSLKNSILGLNGGTVTAGADLRRAAAVTLTSGGGNVIGWPLVDSSAGYPAFTPLASDQIGTAGSRLDPLLGAVSSPDNIVPPFAMPLAGSPAIDMAVTGTVVVDERGVSRPIGAAADAGAIEYGCSGTDSDDDGIPDACDPTPGVCAVNPCGSGTCVASGESYLCL